jgi:hypothetical protein
MSSSDNDIDENCSNSKSQLTSFDNGAQLRSSTAFKQIYTLLYQHHRPVQLTDRGGHSYPKPREFDLRGRLKGLRATAFQRVRVRHEDHAIVTLL